MVHAIHASDASVCAEPLRHASRRPQHPAPDRIGRFGHFRGAMSATEADLFSVAEGDAPPSFICPIGGAVMRDPAICADGHSYERACIERWLSDHTTSPMTNARLAHRNLTANHTLRNLIEEFLEKTLKTTTRSTITIAEVIGSGSFKTVHAGTLRGHPGRVAVLKMRLGADLRTEVKALSRGRATSRVLRAHARMADVWLKVAATLCFLAPVSAYTCHADAELCNNAADHASITPGTYQAFAKYSNRKTWDQAKNECASRGMILAAATSQQQFVAIREMLKRVNNHGSHFWMGGSKGSGTTTWTWPWGDSFYRNSCPDYTYGSTQGSGPWRSGEPNGSGAKCMRYSGARPGWLLASAWRRRRFRPDLPSQRLRRSRAEGLSGALQPEGARHTRGTGAGCGSWHRRILGSRCRRCFAPAIPPAAAVAAAAAGAPGDCAHRAARLRPAAAATVSAPGDYAYRATRSSAASRAAAARRPPRHLPAHPPHRAIGNDACRRRRAAP